MNVDYIIVQAGGKGTRMEKLTANKPKALVPINNLPMLFHLFQKYPEKKYIIIGDYKYDVLEKYLRTFAKVQYYLVDAEGKKGTCAGVQQALKIVPENKSFMLIWSDLVLPKEFAFPEKSDNYIGISTDFRCRWSYKNGVFEEVPSEEYGVAGLFILENKMFLSSVPEEGEFVKWMQGQNKHFSSLKLCRTKEYGLIAEYNKLKKEKCRPFNRLIIDGDRITKEGIDEQGKKLAIRERAWYQLAKARGFLQIPEIYSYDPLVMERVHGKNIYEDTYSHAEKEMILKKIVDALKKLHDLDQEEVNYFSCDNAYFRKTYDRLNQVRDLIPFANQKYITVNGKKCPNVYYFWDEFETLCRECVPEKFVFLHGDCTFSNTMVNENGDIVFIDPRGYFGYTEMNGDAAYDWAKLYYSLKGNYDQFNLKRFILKIENGEVDIQIESNGWEDMENFFFELLPKECTPRKIKIIHALIWLSLTTYAWEDYDSICGAFYQGIYHLEEVLQLH